MKTILEVITSGSAYLVQHGVDEARLNMEHLLAHILGCRRLDLYLRYQETLQEPELKPLRDLLRRRGEGVPLQHLLGTVHFLEHEFVSDHRALIPRPETEYLVEVLIKEVSDGQKKPPTTLLDMGTGSGCIGLSLASAWPSTEVTLADISEEALDLAALNASRLGLKNICLRRSSLFEKLPGRWNMIVANLPYIPTEEIKSLSREVRFDPKTALDGGKDGLETIRSLLEAAPLHLCQEGRVILEVGYDQAAKVEQICKDLSYSNINTFKDLSCVSRFVSAQWLSC
jgi:release factor glutamine methyltransferase